MKKFLAVLLALSMLLALAACGSAAPAAQQTTAPVEDQLENQESAEGLNDAANAESSYIRDKLTIVDKTATSLAPWGTNNDIPGNYEVYEMLYECDKTGAIYPLLADGSYDGSYLPGCDHEAGTPVYEVHIYDYITDHNNNKVTASDVAFSYMYQFQNESTSGWGDLVSVEAKDDTTVVFTFTQEQAGLGQMENILCRCFIVDEDSYNASASKLVNEMCGTGPYKFDSYTSGASVTIVKNDSYWQTDELRRQEQQANVNTLVYEFIDENAQKNIALQTGAVDMVTNLDYEGSLDFADGGKYDEQYNVFTYLQKFVYYINCNCSENSPCQDVNLRMAIYNAIDVDGIVTALGGTMVRLPSYASPYYSDYDFVDWAGLDNYNTKTSVDADLVNDYLSKSNYDGSTLTIITAGVADASTVIAAQLAAFGINAEVQSLDFSSARAAEGDSTAWDMEVGMMAGDYNVTVWQHGFSYQNTDGTHSSNFVVDDEWNALLDECCTVAGHTPENMAKWWQTAMDNAYTMALYTGNAYNVVPGDMTYVCQGDKLVFLPGGCTYAAPNA